MALVLGASKPSPEYAVVHQRIDFARAELLDDAAANGRLGTCGYGARLDPHPVEEGRDCLRMFDRGSED